MKQSVSHQLTDSEYFLDISNNCINLRGDTEYVLQDIVLVTNITHNEVLYNPLCSGSGGSMEGNNLILDTQFLPIFSGNDALSIVIRMNIPLEGRNLDSSKVIEENSYLLENILIELKINNKILREAFHIDVSESDVSQ